jgi:hypothetical protein
MYIPRLFFCLFAGLLALPVAAQKIKTAEIRPFDGAPALWVNGERQLPFLYALTHVVGGRWSWEELPAHNLRNACSDGIRLYQVDLWFEDLWLEGQKNLNMDLARRQLRGVLNACPEAGIVVRLHVNAPGWWNRAHPGECVEFANAPLENYPEGFPFNHEDGDNYRSLRASLASELWRREAGKRVVEFCKKLARTPEGRAVMGIHLSCGVYGEWHPWGFVRSEPDVSPPMQKAFRKWLKHKYTSDQNLQVAWNTPEGSLATATVPDTTARRCCADGFFRDPKLEQQVIDFYRCQQEVIADDIEFFCRTVKENWPRRLITGVFYGYYHFSLCRQAMAGHLEAERLLKSPWIDYFAGPTSYNKPSREAGGSGLQRSIVQSVLRHGKMWFDEVDNGYLQNKFESDFVRSRALGDSAYLPVLQRSLWLPLMQGCGLWLYDFGPRRNAGWWDGDMYRKEFRSTLAFFSKEFVHKTPAPAEALVVWDAESFYHVENVTSKTCEQGLDAAAEDIQRCGVPTDHTFLFDLPRIDLSPYRAILFMNAWKLSPEQRRFIRDSVAAGRRTLIWNYGAGYSDGQRLGKEYVEDLTGIMLLKAATSDTIRWEADTFNFANVEHIDPFFTIADTTTQALGYLAGTTIPVIGRKKTDSHTSVYAGVPLHGSEMFRRLFREAGCFVWNERNDFTYKKGGYILLHAKEPGPGILQLKNGTRVDYNVPAPVTFFLDAKTGTEILQPAFKFSTTITTPE